MDRCICVSRTPLPLGVTQTPDGLNFSIVSRNATEASLVLFTIGDAEPFLELPLDTPYFRTGDVWHVCIDGLERGFETAGASTGGRSRARGSTVDPSLVLVDPYARAISTVFVEGRAEKRGVHTESSFDWKFVHQPLLPETEKQASALKSALGERLASATVEVFAAMRYWTPLTEETAARVAQFAPDEVVRGPLLDSARKGRYFEREGRSHGRRAQDRLERSDRRSALPGAAPEETGELA